MPAECLPELVVVACCGGDVRPLAPEPLRGLPAHTATGPNLPDLRPGTVLADADGPRFAVIGRVYLPLAAGGSASCPLLAALRDAPAGPIHLTAERTGRALARITLSDKGAAGLRRDESGPALSEAVRASGFVLAHEQSFLLPDEPAALRALVTDLALHQGYDLILCTGGTGLSPRDLTPEALLPLLDRRLPGFEQAMLAAGLTQTPHAVISRPVAGTLDRTLILALPGSRKAALENLAAVLPALPHALDKLHGDMRDCGR